MPQSNDHLSLTPQVEFGEARSLQVDIQRLLIGTAEYGEGPTGCTVFRFPGGVQTAVDVRGGLVGTTQIYEYCSAVCFAGGSLLGLAACSGVAQGIFAQGGHKVEKAPLPIINGAIIYDFARNNTIFPDEALGRAALETAKPGQFLLGARGAGRSARVGSLFDYRRHESSGQGGAYRDIDGVKLAVFTVVNALGCIYDRSGQIVRGNFDRNTGRRIDVMDELESRLVEKRSTKLLGGNTTLSLLVTNVKLDREQLTQLGRQVHSSMARAIRPFHTEMDGDVFYTVTTGELKSSHSAAALGLAASELAWDAILSIYG